MAAPAQSAGAARRLISTKRVFEDGLIVQVVIWWVPRPVRPATHRFKYSLFCGRTGVRIVGFDNERGKGDHRHVLGREEAYRFVTLEQLLDDFALAVEQATGRRI